MLPAHAPADDRHAAARPAEPSTPLRRASRIRRSTTATTLALRRPAPLRHRRAAARRPRRSTRSSPRGSGVEPFDDELHRPSTCARWRAGARAPIKAFLLDQRTDRRRRQHLRRRGAVPRAGPPAAPGRQADARAVRRCCATTVVEALQAGIDARGATIDDFRHLDGVARLLPGPRSSCTCARASRARAAATTIAQDASSPGAGPTCASAASRARAARGSCRWRAEQRPAHRGAALLGERHRLLERLDPQRRVALQRLVLRPLLAALGELLARLPSDSSALSASNHLSSSTSQPPCSSP